MRRKSILYKKNKKAVSAIIGYVLLVTFGIIMAAMVYDYLKTYIPRDALKCPDGVSVILEDYDYNCTSGELNITLKNNGKFNFAGYYIHGANRTEQKIATINMVPYFVGSENEEAKVQYDSYITFSDRADNTVMPPMTVTEHYFFIPPEENINNITMIEITPVRYEKSGNTIRFASCGNANIHEEIVC